MSSTDRSFRALVILLLQLSVGFTYSDVVGIQGVPEVIHLFGSKLFAEGFRVRPAAVCSQKKKNTRFLLVSNSFFQVDEHRIVAVCNRRYRRDRFLFLDQNIQTLTASFVRGRRVHW